MAIDLTKLAPAPWKHVGDCRVEGPPLQPLQDGTPCMTIYDEGGHNETDAEFIALARNAFDVMMRRGWSFVLLESSSRWVLMDTNGWLYLNGKNFFSDTPVGAAEQMIEADSWLTEREQAAAACKL